jgi:Bacterial Ig-like domain (group 3)
MRLIRKRDWAQARATINEPARLNTRGTAAANRDRARSRLTLELVQLEDRQLLTTFTVSNTLDTVTSGVPASGTLRWAVEQANLSGGTDEIDFSPAVFGTPQAITFGSGNGAIVMSAASAAITIDGPGPGLLTINDNNNGAVFEVAAGVTAAISGLTISGASLGGNGAVDDLGAVTLSNCALTANTISGLYVKGTADVSDCTISGNNNFSGGGVCVKTGGMATITASTLTDNTCAGGGGLWSAGTVTMADCVVTQNSSLGSGGGIYNSGQLTVTDCTISGNYGTGVTNGAGSAYLSGSTISGNSGFINGGNFANSYGATLNLTSCTVTGGTAGAGGGLYNGGKATVTDCTFSGNTTSGQGGGIVNGTLETKCVLILTDSTLSGNTSTNGGGGGLLTRGTSTLTDDTIVDNSAGGGLNNDGTATIVDCTISGNTTANAGGGIYNGGLGPNVVKLYDTIVAGNFSTQSGSAVASDIDINNGTTLSGSFDLIGVGGSGGLVNGSSGNIVLTTLTDLGLAPLGDYGGPTETMALEKNSVAIGAGKSNISGVTLPTTDQRGFPLDTPHQDIGAFQTSSGGPLVVAVTTDNGLTTSPGALDLRAAVGLANFYGGDATITFDPTVFSSPQTITLTQGYLELTDTTGTISIDGPTTGLTISGDGASRVFLVDSGVSASFSELTIAEGTASSGAGLSNQGTTQLTDCTLSANSATGIGGAVFNGDLVSLTNCTLSGNLAAGGGAIANSGTATLAMCTLSGNTAAVGGGIDNISVATATLEDTLVAANVDSGGAASDIGGANAAGVTGTFDVVGTGGSGGITGTGDIILTTLAGLGLAPLGSYDGPNATIALLPGSPAIGAGTEIEGIITDERGELLDTPAPDVGAFQSQGFGLTPATGSTPQVTITGTAFSDPLAVTVTANNPDEPVAGGVTTFTVNPASGGASADLSDIAAIISDTGCAQVMATANSVAGSYTVIASTGMAAPAEFDLTNLFQPSFSGAVNQTIVYGTGSVTVTGTLADASGDYATGSVDITINGSMQPANLGSDGGFSTTFANTAGLAVTSSPYTISLSYVGNGLFAPANTTGNLTVTQAVPTVTVTDSGGNYNDLPFPATDGVAGVSGQSASSLEGVKVSLSYYAGTYTSASQLSGRTPLSNAPIGAGAYTVLASFAGSSDYSKNSAIANFTIGLASPIVTVADAGGTYNGAAFGATDSVQGIHGAAGGSLEGKDVSLAYYSGTYTTDSQLTGLTPLAAAPSAAGAYTTLASFPGSSDYASGSALANFAVQSVTPEVSVADDDGGYTGAAFAATASVAGLDGQPGPSLEGVSPSLSYYAGTYTSVGQLAGVDPLAVAPIQVGSYTVLATFAGSTDYLTATALANLNIAQVAPTITWGPVTPIVYGTPLGSGQLDAQANVPGSFSYSPVAGIIPAVGTDQVLAVTFTPQDTLDYTTATATATITVERATPTFELSDLGGTFDGSPFAASVMMVGPGGDNSPATSLEGATPTLMYYDGSGTSGNVLGSKPPSAVGTYTVVASFAGTADFSSAQSSPVTFTISAADAKVTLTSSASAAVFGQPISFVATVTAAGAPGGTVTFLDSGTALATVALDDRGTAVLTTSTLATGSNSITAIYNGDAELKGAQSQSAPESVAPSRTSIVLVPLPMTKKKKVKSEVLTAKITPISPGGGVPTGVVTFELLTKKKKKVTTKVLGTAATSGGDATLTLKPRLVLSKVITITYSGDSSFTASTLTGQKLSKKGLL